MSILAPPWEKSNREPLTYETTSRHFFTAPTKSRDAPAPRSTMELTSGSGTLSTSLRNRKPLDGLIIYQIFQMCFN